MAKGRSKKAKNKDIGILASEELTEAKEPVNFKEPEPAKSEPRQIRFENRIPKRNIFLADSYRAERDAKALEDKIREIGLPNYKRNALCVTTIKHMVIDEQGDWVTSFIIDLKG